MRISDWSSDVCSSDLADTAAVRKAIAAAAKAAPAMAAFPHDARRDVLEHCVARSTERHEELALALCIEAGKPIRAARAAVTRLIDTFPISAASATHLGGEVIDLEISRRPTCYPGMPKPIPTAPTRVITTLN